MEDEEHEMIMEKVADRIEKVFMERAMHVKLIEGILKQSDDFQNVMSGLKTQIEPIKKALASDPQTKDNLQQIEKGLAS
jgi:hypothetical protein